MTKYIDEFKSPIIKRRVRILRPNEYKALLQCCTKPHHRTMLQALLYTGMRYVELQRLQKYPNWFDTDFINLPKMADRKVMRKQPERTVRLNQTGKTIMEYFLRLREPLPAYQNWRDNMRRWGIRAKLDPTGLGVKTTRKTWESWLVFYYGQTRMTEIALSQGHDTLTSLNHYLNMPFTQVDRLEMQPLVEGW